MSHPIQSMKRALQVLLASFALLLAGGALAATPEPPQATLSAQASAVVAQDHVRVTLAADLADADQQAASAALNARLDAARKRIGSPAKTTVRTGEIRLWPTTDRDGRITQWRARGELILESSDFAATAQLAASLADQVSIAQVVFSVSPALRTRTEQALLGQAVEAFQARAEALSQALGFGAYRVQSVQLDGTGRPPVAPLARMMSAAADAPSPAAPLEGGDETISVALHGTVALLPK